MGIEDSSKRINDPATAEAMAHAGDEHRTWAADKRAMAKDLTDPLENEADKREDITEIINDLQRILKQNVHEFSIEDIQQVKALVKKGMPRGILFGN